MIQISLMGKIYSHVYRVIIWLGPTAENSDTIFDIIDRGDVEKMRDSNFAGNLTRLLQYSWFSCTWTVQEFVLSKTLLIIVCGTKMITSG
jgi:hypothetical protein